MSQERSLIKERTESLGLNAIIGNQLQQYGATPRRDGKPLPPPPSKVSRTQTSITSDLNPADKQYYPPVPKTGRALPTPPGQANSSKASLVNSNTNLNSTNNGHSSVNFTHYGGVASGANSLKKASIRTPPPIPQHLRRPSDLTGENRLSSDNLPPAPEPPTPPPASAKPFQPKKEVEKEAAPVITVPKPKVDPEIVERYAHPTEDQEIAAIICQTYWRRFMAMKQLRKLKSMAYHRQKCATEILDTERFYVKNLQMIVEVYLKTFQEMAKQSNPLITAKQVSTIFSDLEVIAQFNAVFLKQLEERLTVYDPRKPLSDIFLYIAPFFKTYTRYCNNYDNALACLNQVRKNPEFMEVLGKLDKDERTSKLGLTSYLIMPIQRIPRYRLLLQDLIKHTTTDHPDYDKLNEALTKIMEVANHLNSGMRNAENANKIIAIQNQFDQENDFLVPHRRFIRDGSLTREDKEKGPQQIHLHLFNDLLVFSRKVGNNRFAFISKIELNSSAIYDFDDDDTKFQIKTPDHSFILRATPDDKQEWLRDLNAAIESSRASHSDKATLKVDVNSIRDDSSTTFALAMADDSENLTISAREAVVQMKTGSVMLKYCRNAKPHFRRFLLSADEKTFMWGSPRKNATESSVSIYDIKMVIVGQRTAIFQRYKNPDLENLSFSILYRDRTLDIVCKDKKEFIIWVEGLRFLLSRHPDEGLVVPEHVQPALSEGSDDTSSTEPVSPAAALISRTNEKKNFEEAFTRIGDAFSWGQGTRGALGHGNQSDQNSPLVMADFLYLDVIAMDCENLSAAVITATGELFTWGAGDQGKLGHGDKSDRLKPTLVKALKGSKITQVSIGAVHMLALDDNNRVYAWGGNESGQLGLGDVNPRDTPTLIEALKGKKVIKIDCGLWHSAVITDDGQLYTWGRGEDGQLGHGQATNVLSPTVVAKLRTPVSEVACGLWHTMALCDGQVYSWGNSTYGQLGHTNKDSVLEPKRIDFFVRQGKTITAIAAGSSHSGCITSIGEVYMWGNGIYGQIGNDKKDNTNDTPVHVEALVHEKVIQLVCGTNHNLALTESGKVYAWGAGTYGRLGIGSEIDQKVPTVIPNLLDKQVRNVAAGGSQSGAVCAHMWVPDKDLPHCMACKKKFTFTNRRHHCRNCGGLFCGTCTSKRLPLLRFGFNEPVRVCNNCYQILQVHQK